MIFAIEDIEIDTDRFELRRGGRPFDVEPQVFALIELLVANRDRLVTKDEINMRVWGGRIVSDSALNTRIRSARHALGDDGKTQRLIKTVHGRGFRFVGAPVRETGAVPLPAHASAKAGASTRVDAAGQILSGRPSIAVLPFHMLSDGGVTAPLADAVAHEVIVELARLYWLRVINRGSSFRFRGPDVDIAAASDILDVGYVLTGSVSVHAQRATVTAELMHTGELRVIWADRFEGPIDDLLVIRRTIAAAIVTAVDVRLPLNEAARHAALPTEDLDSWAAYHRGLQHMFRFTSHDNAMANRMFKHAVTLDPGFARAHAGLSFTHFQNAFVGYCDRSDAETERRMARSSAERSLELDPLDPFTNLSAGRADMLDGDLTAASTWFDRSIDLSPNYAMAFYIRALTDTIAGESGRGMDGIAKALSLSPVDPMHYAMLATRALACLVDRDYIQSASWAERAARTANAHLLIHVIAAVTNELAGERVRAKRWTEEARRNDQTFDKSRFFQAFPFRDDDLSATVDAALDRLGF